MKKRIVIMKKRQKIQLLLLLLPAAIGFHSCGNWLDIVPDQMGNIDMVFNARKQALKYLATCYSYMPKDADIESNPALLGSDELTVPPEAWPNYWPFSYSGFYLNQGAQKASNPLFNNWGSWYQALRDCNIFIENVDQVPDMSAAERQQWKAEVMVLKAYYHFLLVRQYGPIPLVRENLPVGADVSTVKVVREPVDECFRYIVELIDEAVADDKLLMTLNDEANELGRITKPIALTLKAKVLVTAASDLFNGNSQQATLRNHDGTRLFNPTWDITKWEAAMVACGEAITACHRANLRLYEFSKEKDIFITSDTIATQMSLRNAFTLPSGGATGNPEIIWANTQSAAGSGHKALQQISAAKLGPSDTWVIHKNLWVPLKIAEMFYTANGVPLNEDNTRNYNDRYNLRTAQEVDRLYLKVGSETVDLHFDREPRFYAWLGFDCGVWYGQGRYIDTEPLWTVQNRVGEFDGGTATSGNPAYYAKKYIHYQNVIPNTENYTINAYPWPLLRLSDLYLLYAEAINEVEGPAGAHRTDLFFYLNAVRKRAGLKEVEYSWTYFSNDPTKFERTDGLRNIIRQERLNELAFEGQRFWDLRRWKTAPAECNTDIEGWSHLEKESAFYYQRKFFHHYSFYQRDYFWPINNEDIVRNPNLVQNIGW